MIEDGRYDIKENVIADCYWYRIQDNKASAIEATI